MSKPCSHPLIEHMIEESGLTRAEIAKRIGATPKTLYYWEHQITKVKGWMIAKVSEHTGISLESIPACVHKKALAEFERNYATRSEIKAGFKAKPKDEPPPPKSNYTANIQSEERRIKKQASKATDPKRHRIPNFGYPTAANKNPSTFNGCTPGQGKLSKGSLDIPSDAEYPDLIGAALDPLNCYEAVWVDKHLFPSISYGISIGSNPYTAETGRAFYWKRPDGRRSQAHNIDQAKTLIATQIAEDEAALLKDLI